MNAVVAVAGVGIVFLLISLATYNGLMHLRRNVRLAWASLDQQLKRRYEIIVLLPSAMPAMEQEFSSLMPAIISAKNQALVAIDPIEHAAAEAAISTAVDQLLSAMTNSTWRAKPQTADFFSMLTTNQKQIAQSCRRYNEHVLAFNASMVNFPNDVTARVFGLRPQPLFSPVERPTV